MTMRKVFLAVAGAGALAMASMPAYSLDTDAMYFGVDVGNTDYEASEGGVTAEASSTGFRLRLGLPINESLNFEAAWIDQGEGDVDNGGGAKLAADGLQFSVMGLMPAGDNLKLFGRLGLYMWNGELKDAGAFSGSDDGTDLFYGLGLDYAVSDTMDIRLEYDFATVSTTIGTTSVDIDANSLSLGVSFRQ